MDNTLKAVLESPYELVVENHIVLFGGRDLTGIGPGGKTIEKNEDGSVGEFFSKATEVESDYTRTGRLYVDFEHGRDPDGIGADKHSILGYVDWKTAKVTDEGIIVRRVLNRRHEYMKWLEPLIKAGVVGNSSESIGGQAAKAANGEIVKWPLRRDTLTVTPMEPRMIAENLLAVKAMSEVFPVYKALIPPDTALPGKDETKQTEKVRKENNMDENEIKNLVAQGIAEAEKARVAEATAKAERDAEIKKAADEAYKKAVDDIKAAGPQSFYHSTEPSKESDEGLGGFKHWMATGQVNGDLIRPNEEFMKAQASYYVGNEGKAAWNATTGASGAFLVPDPLYNQIIAKRDIASWVRQAPCQYFQTSADHLLVPREDTKLTDFVLTAEAGSYDENEATVSQKDLILYKYTKLTKVSEEFLMYQGTNWESWFANTLGRAVAGTENTIYTTGTGTNQPEGVVTNSTVGNTTATTDVILPSELTALFGYLGAGYNVPSECRLLGANVTKWYLKGSGGTAVVPFAYVPTPQGGDFFGYEYIIDDDIDPYTTASAKILIFGNFNFYGVVEKPGMVVQRNPYLYMATGQIGIFASIFRGGGILQTEAFYHMLNHS